MYVYSSNTSSHKAFFLSLLKGVAILSIVKVPIYALCVVIDLNYSKILGKHLLARGSLYCGNSILPL